jgi:recombination protein RecA
MGAVLTAQVRGEPAAWVAVRSHGLFYPPDAAEAGVDLAALAVVLVPDAAAAGRAADRLVRSGAFGLVVLDLGPEAELPMPLMARLVRLAAAHATAVLCLTVKPPGRPSLGSLVSLRAQARHQRLEGGRFACTLEVLKDKRRGPGRCWEEVRRGPAGLR